MIERTDYSVPMRRCEARLIGRSVKARGRALRCDSIIMIDIWRDLRDVRIPAAGCRLADFQAKRKKGKRKKREAKSEKRIAKSERKFKMGEFW